MAVDADVIVVGGGLAGLVAATEIARRRPARHRGRAGGRTKPRRSGFLVVRRVVLRIGIFPVVGWAERGGYDAMGHGNSVPRFDVTWGTDPGCSAATALSCRGSTP